MLTELNFEDGRCRIDLIDGTTMSILTAQCRYESDVRMNMLDPIAGLLYALGKAQGLNVEPIQLPEHLVEVAFVHPDRQQHLPEVLVPEWLDNLRSPELSGTWTIYEVTPQQVIDYANKVGVK